MYRKRWIIAQISEPNYCNYAEIKTILLFLETEILDVPGAERGNANERERSKR